MAKVKYLKAVIDEDIYLKFKARCKEKHISITKGLEVVMGNVKSSPAEEKEVLDREERNKAYNEARKELAFKGNYNGR